MTKALRKYPFVQPPSKLQHRGYHVVEAPPGASLLRCQYLERISHLAVNRFHQLGTALHIKHSHSTYMSSEVSFPYEIGSDCLVQSRRKDVSRIAGGRESRHQILGDGHVTQT